MVHEGFHDALNEQLDSIDEAMRSLGMGKHWIGTKEMPPVVCVGHSLGGALAVLMAGRMRRRAVCAVTFGSPKLLSKWSDREPEFRILNVIHGFDSVPRLPHFGFRSAGEYMYWGSGPTSRFFWRPFVRGLKDHRMNRYYQYIAQSPADDRLIVGADGAFVMLEPTDEGGVWTGTW